MNFTVHLDYIIHLYSLDISHQYWPMKRSTTTLLLSWRKWSIYFGVGYGECVHPHTPATPLMLDGVVEKNPEDVVNHLSDLLLLWVLRVNVAEREHPVLPNGTLQQTPVTREMRWIKLAAVTRVKPSSPPQTSFFTSSNDTQRWNLIHKPTSNTKQFQPQPPLNFRSVR